MATESNRSIHEKREHLVAELHHCRTNKIENSADADHCHALANELQMVEIEIGDLQVTTTLLKHIT